jgi:NADPH-dependent ferric siderophore reductase
VENRMNKIHTRASRIERVRHELMQRRPQVVAVEQPTPGFVRVSLQGDDLKGFPSQSFDDHIKVLLTDENGEPVRRDYTPRAFDPVAGTMVLEFALHDGGTCCEWARNLKVGETVALGGPKGSMIIPMDFDWHWLIGDPTSLPAINRRLEELPTAMPVTVVVQVNDDADQRAFDTAARVEVIWVRTHAELLSAVRSLTLPQGRGFVWAAGEGVAMTELRRIVLDEKQQPSEDARISAYWKQGHRGYSDKG